MLTKTLTFGVGNPCLYDVRKKEIVPIEDEQRRSVYVNLREGAKCFAAIVNQAVSRMFASAYLGVSKGAMKDFTISYKPILDRMEFATNLSGSAMSQTFGVAKTHFSKEHGKNLLARGTKSLPSQRTDGTHPIYYRASGTLLLTVAGKYWFVVNAFSKDWAKANGAPSGWIAFPLNIKPRDKSSACQLDLVRAGASKLKGGQIRKSPKRKGPKWEASLIIEFEPETRSLRDDTVLGIDLGINAPATVHARTDGVGRSWAVHKGDGRGLLATRGLIRREIVSLIRSLRTKHSGLQGRARGAALNRLRDLRKKERRIVKTGAQTVAAQIAEIAIRECAGVWQMEDLTKGDLRKNSWIARNWAPGALVDAVRWRAAQAGAELILVNPAYTSQRCSTCGHIDRKNRPKGKKGAGHFECIACGHSENADKNAARNLSTPNIAAIIEEYKALNSADSARAS